MSRPKKRLSLEALETRRLLTAEVVCLAGNVDLDRSVGWISSQTHPFPAGVTDDTRVEIELTYDQANSGFSYDPNDGLYSWNYSGATLKIADHVLEAPSAYQLRYEFDGPTAVFLLDAGFPHAEGWDAGSIVLTLSASHDSVDKTPSLQTAPSPQELIPILREQYLSPAANVQSNIGVAGYSGIDGRLEFAVSEVHLGGCGLPDIVATELNWDPINGGLRAGWEIQGNDITSTESFEVDVWWAKSSGDHHSQQVEKITKLASFTSGTNVGPYSKPITFGLDEAPEDASGILLSIDSDDRVTEKFSGNNQAFLSDVVLSMDANREFRGDPYDPSAYTLDVLKDLLRVSGQESARITSGYRTAEDQARIMFDNATTGYKPDKTIEKGTNCKSVPKDIDFDVQTNSVKYSFCLYGSYGDEVISTYVSQRALQQQDSNISDADIIDAMAATIEEIKNRTKDLPPNQKLPFSHTLDFRTRQTYDIAPSSLRGDHRLLENAILWEQSKGRIERHFSPYTVPKDKAFHIEVVQPVAASPPPTESTSDLIRRQLTKSLSSSRFETSPAEAEPVSIDLSFGQGGANASVSNARQNFFFDAAAGDLVSVFVTVTDIHEGDEYTDDDTVVYLLDSDSTIVAMNDDADPIEHDSQSVIDAFRVIEGGTLEVVVTTFGNAPILDDSSRVVGWEDDGGSHVDFEIAISALNNTDFTSAFDVNFSHDVTPLDALLVINAIGRAGGAAIDLRNPPGIPLPPFPDVNRDGRVSPLDALQIINQLARRSNDVDLEGEQTRSLESDSVILSGQHTDPRTEHDEDPAREQPESNIEDSRRKVVSSHSAQVVFVGGEMGSGVRSGEGTHSDTLVAERVDQFMETAGLELELSE